MPDIHLTPVDELVRAIRAQSRATALLDGAIERLKYVIDPREGVIIVNAPGVLREVGQVTLAIPDEGDGPELLVDVRELDPMTSAGCDRWRIYHDQGNSPRHRHWFALPIDSAKHEGEVFSGDDIDLRNPFAGDEPRLCKALSARGGAVVVGIDPDGVDRREHPRGVVRHSLPRRAGTLGELRTLLGLEAEA